MFDVLTYEKGGSLLRMLEQYLGTERFRDGVRRYLAAHRYGNTETTDLWDAIEEAAEGEPIRALMDSWIRQGGHPLVTARAEGPEVVLDPGALLLPARGRPRPTGSEPSAIGSSWLVPVATERRPARRPAGRRRAPLRPAPRRAHPDPGRQRACSWSTPEGAASSACATRTACSTTSSPASTGSSRSSASRSSRTPGRARWPGRRRSSSSSPSPGASRARRTRACGRWSRERSACWTSPSPTRPWRRSRPSSSRCSGPSSRRVGLGSASTTTTTTARRRRAVLIGTLGTVGADPAVRARELATGSPPFDQGARAGCRHRLGRSCVSWPTTAGRAEYDTLLAHFRSPADPLEEQRYLDSLSYVRDLELAAETCELCLTEIRSQDAPYVLRKLLTTVSSVRRSGSSSPTHWTTLLERVPRRTRSRGCSRSPASASSTRTARLGSRARSAAFCAAHPLGGQQRAVDQRLERLAVNVRFVLEQRPHLGLSPRARPEARHRELRWALLGREQTGCLPRRRAAEGLHARRRGARACRRRRASPRPASPRIVEVGAYCGRSTLYLACGDRPRVRARERPAAVIFSVDHHHGSEENQAGWEHHDETLVDPATGRMDTLPFWRRAVEGAGAEDLAVAVVGDSPAVAARFERRRRAWCSSTAVTAKRRPGPTTAAGHPASPRAAGSPSTTSSPTPPMAAARRSRSTCAPSTRASSPRRTRRAAAACACSGGSRGI